jgi:hypothetical protein
MRGSTWTYNSRQRWPDGHSGKPLGWVRLPWAWNSDLQKASRASDGRAAGHRGAGAGRRGPRRRDRPVSQGARAAPSCRPSCPQLSWSDANPIQPRTRRVALRRGPGLLGPTFGRGCRHLSGLHSHPCPLGTAVRVDLGPALDGLARSRRRAGRRGRHPISTSSAAGSSGPGNCCSAARASPRRRPESASPPSPISTATSEECSASPLASWPVTGLRPPGILGEHGQVGNTGHAGQAN